jgi:hypothetical protein
MALSPFPEGDGWEYSPEQVKQGSPVTPVPIATSHTVGWTGLASLRLLGYTRAKQDIILADVTAH